MAAASSQEGLEEELTCPICLQIFSDPVILGCNHSFCRDCIEKTWKELNSEIYSCPECEAEFLEKPCLEDNVKLANIAQIYRNHDISLDPLPCNYCTDDPQPAVKTCLKCEASMCLQHLKPHTENPVFKNHPLVDAAEDIALWKCNEHNKLLEIYCMDDEVCICTFCTVVGQHKKHNCTSIDEGEKELRARLQQRMDMMQQNLDAAKVCLSHFQDEKQKAEDTIKDVKGNIREKYDGLRKMIRREEKDAFQFLDQQESRVTGSIDNQLSMLESRIETFKMFLNDLTKLADEKEEVIFIQRLSEWSEPFSSPPPPPTLETPKLEELSRWIQRHCMECLQKEKNRNLMITLYGSSPILDPNTAFPNLILSDNNKTVQRTEEKQLYPDNPDRFDFFPQVLCSEGVSMGRCYWEVQIKGDGRWGLGVCYKSLNRRGRDIAYSLGMNEKSWSIYSWSRSLTGWHNRNGIKLTSAQPSRVGVFVDFEAGIISFYNVSCNNLTLLHTFQQQTFIEPLCPTLGSYDNDILLSLCELN
ncbi:E3 ubiquitin/ISG15 ligase TRIM25-like [Callorhinchus milii]|uniref:E3 ubiquitin/ISG15 ligase TRIM25-like n=1 Tax=Callorhinchus milii TaxID=7868 RepID=UPI001C3FEC64|nr:E3 ubiquitin/ISG15 ligase TRIM25-like [Callorhinchus milii]